MFANAIYFPLKRGDKEKCDGGVKVKNDSHKLLNYIHKHLLTAPEEDVLKGKQSIRSQALGNQNSESEISLEGDDDTLSSLEDKELENLTGKVLFSSA